MKRAIAAVIIGLVGFSVLGLHAWLTWGSVDHLPPTVPYDDRQLFEYSLFLESFAFLLTAAYAIGPGIYRFFGDASAALKFSGEKDRISKIVNSYAAAVVVLRRLCLDPQMGVPIATTALAILAILIPLITHFLKSHVGRFAPRGSPEKPSHPTSVP